MGQLFKNNAATTLNGAITNSATSIVVTDASVFGAVSSPDIMYLTLVSGTPEDKWEVVKVTAITGNTLTVVRGQDGTSGQAWSNGDKIECRWTKAIADMVGGSTAFPWPMKFGDKANFSFVAPTVSAGDFWFDSTYGVLGFGGAGGHQVYPGGAFFVGTQTSDISVADSTNVDITPSGVLSTTIPANSLKAGSVIELEGWIFVSSNASVKTIKLVYGGSFDTGLAEPSPGQSIYYRIRMTVLSTGPTGSARVSYLIGTSGNAATAKTFNNSTITINTTASLHLGVGMRHATGSSVDVNEHDCVMRRVL